MLVQIEEKYLQSKRHKRTKAMQLVCSLHACTSKTWHYGYYTVGVYRRELPFTMFPRWFQERLWLGMSTRWSEHGFYLSHTQIPIPLPEPQQWGRIKNKTHPEGIKVSLSHHNLCNIINFFNKNILISQY